MKVTAEEDHPTIYLLSSNKSPGSDYPCCSPLSLLHHTPFFSFFFLSELSAGEDYLNIDLQMWIL